MLDPKFLNNVTKHLGPHGPDALLSFALFVVAIGAIAGGIDPWIVVPLVCVLYGGYVYRQGRREKHEERQAELKVEAKEAEVRRVREAARGKLEKAKREQSRLESKVEAKPPARHTKSRDPKK